MEAGGVIRLKMRAAEEEARGAGKENDGNENGCGGEANAQRRDRLPTAPAAEGVHRDHRYDDEGRVQPGGA